MREISFRAWDTQYEEFVNTIGLMDLMGIQTKYEWTQFTGLPDKKGVKIFEGDIIYIAGKGNCVVTFKSCCWKAEIIDNDKNMCNDVFPIIESYMEGDIERVVGNVYENGDLL